MADNISMTPDEAYLHFQYMIIPKVYNKTDKDKECLKMALEAMKEQQKRREMDIEAHNELLEMIEEVSRYERTGSSEDSQK